MKWIVRSWQLAVGSFLILAGCAGTPPPDWKMNAVGSLEQFQENWLQGRSTVATLALGQARGEIAHSARLDLLARAELAACATRIAALDFSPCAAYQRLAAEADPKDRVYAHFLSGAWDGIDTKSLPPQYATLVTARDDDAANRAVADIQQPLPRLIAAALLFKRGRAEPATFANAIDTASERGWVRPLLAWLTLQRARAQAAGDSHAVAHLQARIDLIDPSTK